MVIFCLNEKEKQILKNLIGKRVIKYRHDPLDKFGQETVYGRLELFFDDCIVLINYDYEPYPLFGSDEDEHPRFSIKIIEEDEAVSALQNTEQIDISFGKMLKEVVLVEDFSQVEWDGKTDNVRILKAIIFKFDDQEIAIQGDYMIPLLDIFKGENLKDALVPPGDEFNQPETKYESERLFLKL